MLDELKSWLLADEKCNFKSLRENVKPVKNPESIHNAKEYLEGLFEKGGKKQHLLAEEIAKYVDVEKLRRKCASFADFERKVRNGNVRRRDA